jgi:hypothetical protein
MEEEFRPARAARNVLLPSEDHIAADRKGSGRDVRGRVGRQSVVVDPDSCEPVAESRLREFSFRSAQKTTW